jgi:hypothetical protein
MIARSSQTAIADLHAGAATRCRVRPITLQEAERAARVPLRDARTILDALTRRLQELRALDGRAKALRQDASGLRPGEVLLALLDAQTSDV